MTRQAEIPPAPLKYDAPFQSAYDVVLTSLRVHLKTLPVATASAIASDVALKFRTLDEGFQPLVNDLLEAARGDGRVPQETYRRIHARFQEMRK